MKQTKYGTATSRWAGVGPYYAMFPATFADRVIKRYSDIGDRVLDPFSGRGTAIFSAAVHGRNGLGIEINPVGWIYSKTKLRPAEQGAVADRLKVIARTTRRYRGATESLPSFFAHCYCQPVLNFLLAARDQLDWRRNRVDRTAMALLLINLHGKRDDSLSNQMRQTKSMSPDYAIKWWKIRTSKPPEIDPLEFMLARLQWRYAKGIPETSGSHVYLGDSSHVLATIGRREKTRKDARLLLTSPPYYGVTNYHYDQWLRLWLLGGPPSARRVAGPHRGKFENKQSYRQLLSDVFSGAKRLLSRKAVIYVRTDKRKQTRKTTIDVLTELFPRHQFRRRSRPHRKPTQTRLFGNSDPRLGEVDLVLTP